MFEESFTSPDSFTKNLGKDFFFKDLWVAGLSRKLQEPRQPHQKHSPRFELRYGARALKTLKNKCFLLGFWDFKPLKKGSRAKTAPPKTLKNLWFFKVFGVSGFLKSFQSQDSSTKNLKKQIVFTGFWDFRCLKRASRAQTASPKTLKN